MDFAVACLSSWLASAQWNLSLDRRRDTLEEVVELHVSRTFFQPAIVKATDDESMMITHECVEHFVVVRFAICEVNGVLVSAEPARRHPELGLTRFRGRRRSVEKERRKVFDVQGKAEAEPSRPYAGVQG